MSTNRYMYFYSTCTFVVNPAHAVTPIKQSPVSKWSPFSSPVIDKFHVN